jgi:hypothetical protein
MSEIVSEQLKQAASALAGIDRETLPRQTNEGVERATLDNRLASKVVYTLRF